MHENTFQALCRDAQVHVSNNESFERVRGTMSGAELTIVSESVTSTITVDWMVVAERKDTVVRAWDKTNSDGRLITEHPKK
jgi:hypothetical protein